MKKCLYCSKNILHQLLTGDPEDRDCDGPNGEGIEESCLKNCENAYTNEKKLVTGIGYEVLRKLGK